jgi:magnesium transporter
MLPFMKKTTPKVGLAPGTLVHVGEQKIETARITLFNFNSENLLEKEIHNIEDVRPFKNNLDVTWVNVDGLHDVGIIEQVGELFGIHTLTLEDIVNTNQRPKLEEFDDYTYIVLKMLFLDQDKNRINAEQVSFVLGENFLITFQEMEGDIFDGVRERLRKCKGRIRKKGADYLMYALMDAVIDNYFLILDHTVEQTEIIEDMMLTDTSHRTLVLIHDIKRELIHFRRQVWPLREFLNNMISSEINLIEEPTRLFLRDLYDHSIQVIDTIESLRDVLMGMQDVYLSELSNKMNETMKVLTIIATIFIPVTFIAGVYGMNFKYMPELEQRWAYPAFWVTVVLIIALMMAWFKRKKWLS